MACKFRAFGEYEKKIFDWRLIDRAVVCTAIISNRSILFERAENRKPGIYTKGRYYRCECRQNVQGLLVMRCG